MPKAAAVVKTERRIENFIEVLAGCVDTGGILSEYLVAA